MENSIFYNYKNILGQRNPINFWVCEQDLSDKYQVLLQNNELFLTANNGKSIPLFVFQALMIQEFYRIGETTIKLETLAKTMQSKLCCNEEDLPKELILSSIGAAPNSFTEIYLFTVMLAHDVSIWKARNFASKNILSDIEYQFVKTESDDKMSFDSEIMAELREIVRNPIFVFYIQFRKRGYTRKNFISLFDLENKSFNAHLSPTNKATQKWIADNAKKFVDNFCTNNIFDKEKTAKTYGYDVCCWLEYNLKKNFAPNIYSYLMLNGQEYFIFAQNKQKTVLTILEDVEKRYPINSYSYDQYAAFITSSLNQSGYSMLTQEFIQKLYFKLREKTPILAANIRKTSLVSEEINWVVKIHWEHGIDLSDSKSVSDLIDKTNFYFGKIPFKNFVTFLKTTLCPIGQDKYISYMNIVINDKQLLADIDKFIETTDETFIPYQIIYRQFKERIDKNTNVIPEEIHGVLRKYLDHEAKYRITVSGIRKYQSKSDTTLYRRHATKEVSTFLENNPNGSLTLAQVKNKFPEVDKIFYASFFTKSTQFFFAKKQNSKAYIYDINRCDFSKELDEALLNATKATMIPELQWTNSPRIEAKLRKDGKIDLLPEKFQNSIAIHNIIKLHFPNDFFIYRNSIIGKDAPNNRIQYQDVIDFEIQKLAKTAVNGLCYGSQINMNIDAIIKNRKGYIQATIDEIIKKYFLKIADDIYVTKEMYKDVRFGTFKKKFENWLTDNLFNGKLIYNFYEYKNKNKPLTSFKWNFDTIVKFVEIYQEDDGFKFHVLSSYSNKAIVTTDSGFSSINEVQKYLQQNHYNILL